MRSQFAEALLRLKGYQDVFSAGTHVSPEKEGRLLKDDGEFAVKSIQYFLKKTGLDLSEKKRKRIDIQLVEKADVIVSLVEENTLPEPVKLYKDKLVFWNIEDPVDMNEEGYNQIIDQIQLKINELAGLLQFRP